MESDIYGHLDGALESYKAVIRYKIQFFNIAILLNAKRNTVIFISPILRFVITF